MIKKKIFWWLIFFLPQIYLAVRMTLSDTSNNWIELILLKGWFMIFLPLFCLFIMFVYFEGLFKGDENFTFIDGNFSLVNGCYLVVLEALIIICGCNKVIDISLYVSAFCLMLFIALPAPFILFASWLNFREEDRCLKES